VLIHNGRKLDIRHKKFMTHAVDIPTMNFYVTYEKWPQWTLLLCTKRQLIWTHKLFSNCPNLQIILRYLLCISCVLCPLWISTKTKSIKPTFIEYLFCYFLKDSADFIYFYFKRKVIRSETGMLKYVVKFSNEKQTLRHQLLFI
jgi:hypothetical protein